MHSFISDAVDYKGNPAKRTRTGGWVLAAQILGIEVCERLATMAIVVNIVTYAVGTMHLSSATASNVAANFGGTSFLLCLFGGILADTLLGRFWTIAIFALISTLGTCMLAIITALPQLQPPTCNPAVSNNCEEATSLQMGVFYMALYLYGIGLGGIKSTVSAFGTDQFDQKDDKEKAQMVKFFNRFYFLINLGTLLGVSVLVYVQDEVGRSWGYGICSASMFLAFLTFLSGSRRYRYKKRVGSPIIQILQVLVAALRKRKAEFPSSVDLLYEDYSQGTRIFHTNKYRWLDKASIISNEEELATPNTWRLCSVTRVEEVKMLVGLLPTWATTITFWTVLEQMTSFSVQQASTMDRSLGKFKLPSASYNVFLIGSTLITLAIYDRLFMPLFRKSKRKEGWTSLQKIGIGIFFATLAIAAAALVENRRLKVVARAQGGTSTLTLPISAFYLLPQLILVGIGDAFMYVGQLDFFITHSPKRMKAIGTGLFLTTIALGLFGSTIIVSIVKKATEGHGSRSWFAHRINDGRLDLFYGLLAVLNLISFGIFLACAVKYKPNPGEKAENRNGESVSPTPRGENV